MERFNEIECAKRIVKARSRLLATQPFYAILISRLTVSLTESTDTASTDGERVFFNPHFLLSLTESELDFILLHEVLHVVLKHCFRFACRDDKFNIACDTVINSIILESYNEDIKAITVKGYVSPHLAPNGKEGRLYTAEEMYNFLLAIKPKPSGSGNDKKSDGNSKNNGGKNGGNDSESLGNESENTDKNSPKKDTKNGKNSHEKSSVFSTVIDDHSFWLETAPDVSSYEDAWDGAVINAVKSISIKNPSKTFGGAPMFAQRIYTEFTNPKVDWRTVLNEFVQEEICDYSFTPPDKRYDGDFFLPDFNEKYETVKNVWFVVDTSGSISDEMIMMAYREIKSAVETFGGAIQSYLSFTESFITKPVPFSTIDDLLSIKPVGGGGNNFSLIFKYLETGKGLDVTNNRGEKISVDEIIEPCSIVIITDGYDEFPPESASKGIPTLWIINNNDAKVPWGRVVRI